MSEYTLEHVEAMATLIKRLEEQNSECIKELFYTRRKNRVLDAVVQTDEDKQWFISVVLDRHGFSTAVTVARLLFSSLSLKEAHDMVKSMREYLLQKGEQNV